MRLELMGSILQRLIGGEREKTHQAAKAPFIDCYSSKGGLTDLRKTTIEIDDCLVHEGDDLCQLVVINVNRLDECYGWNGTCQIDSSGKGGRSECAVWAWAWAWTWDMGRGTWDECLGGE